MITIDKVFRWAGAARWGKLGAVRRAVWFDLKVLPETNSVPRPSGGVVLDLYPSLGSARFARSPWAGVGVRSTVYERTPPLAADPLTFRFGRNCRSG